MTQRKTATLNLRIDPGLKEALRLVAQQDHRSIANMVELLIRQTCTERGIAIPEQQTLFDEESSHAKDHPARTD
ncbi:MAG: hypothetical protein PHQ14_08465 [Chromatiales bacterium]|jgi:hypothetical protein|nr:hypothetical protein [Chromatiales bacterium]MDX9767758.1 hypothetical protein [Ectothiorhodospiraceae bacterium]